MIRRINYNKLRINVIQLLEKALFEIFNLSTSPTLNSMPMLILKSRFG